MTIFNLATHEVILLKQIWKMIEILKCSYIDRVPYFPYFTKRPFSPIMHYVFLRHPVAILVIEFINPEYRTAAEGTGYIFPICSYQVVIEEHCGSLYWTLHIRKHLLMKYTVVITGGCHWIYEFMNLPDALRLECWDWICLFWILLPWKQILQLQPQQVENAQSAKQNL